MESRRKWCWKRAASGSEGDELGRSIVFIDKNKIVNFSGGVERVICAFANEFAARGYDTSIVCIDTEEGMPFFPLSDKARFINLCYSYGDKQYNGISYKLRKVQRELMRGLLGRKMTLFGRKFADPKESYFYSEFTQRLARCLSELKPDVVLPTDVESTKVALDAISYAGLNTVVISMCHSDPNRLYYSDEYIEALKKADCVQALLPSFKDFFIRMGISSAVEIPNGVAQCRAEEMADLTKPKNRIVTVGRIDGAGKRQHLLIEAFSLIADRFPDWTVDIYGDVANKRYKRRLNELVSSRGLSGRVNFLGTAKDIVSKYREADIFAFPTEYEGFGLAMAEAMSAGLPALICKECTGAADVAGDCGIAVEEGTEAYSEGLSMLMSDMELRIKFGKAGHERMKMYSFDIVWSQWEGLIESLCQEKGGVMAP